MIKKWFGKMFHNGGTTKWLIAAFVTLLVVAFATKLRAEESVFAVDAGPRLSFGMGGTTVRGPAPVLGLNIQMGRGPLDTHYECGIILVGDSGPDNPNNFGGQCLLVDGLGKFDIGFGLAYLQNRDVYNGSNLNFALLARYRISSRWHLVLDNHWSNAGTKMPNRGRDMMMLYYVF